MDVSKNILDEEEANDDAAKTYRKFPPERESSSAIVIKENVDNDDDENSYHSFGTSNSSNKKKKEVDKKIFLPLYVATACVLLLPVLPLFLRIFLVTFWAILFIWTPLYYLYHYDPDNNAAKLCCEGCCAQDNTMKT